MTLDRKSVFAVRDSLSEKLDRLCAEHSRLKVNTPESPRKQAELSRLDREINRVVKAIWLLEDSL